MAEQLKTIELYSELEMRINELHKYVFDGNCKEINTLQSVFKQYQTVTPGLFRGVSLSKSKLLSMNVGDKVNLGYSYTKNKGVAYEFASPKVMFPEDYSCIIILNDGFGLETNAISDSLLLELINIKHLLKDKVSLFNELKSKLNQVINMVESEQEIIIFNGEFTITKIEGISEEYRVIKIFGEKVGES